MASQKRRILGWIKSLIPSLPDVEQIQFKIPLLLGVSLCLFWKRKFLGKRTIWKLRNTCQIQNGKTEKMCTKDLCIPSCWASLHLLKREALTRKEIIIFHGWLKSQVRKGMELFSRRLVSAQLSNEFGYCPLCTASIALAFHTYVSLPLGIYPMRRN